MRKDSSGVEKSDTLGETTVFRSQNRATPIVGPILHDYHAPGRRTLDLPRAKVGAVIVRDRSILATGYNGAPAGLPHCLDVGCLVYESRTPDGDIEQNCYRTIHAEINAITQAARNGSAIRDADIYVTHTPCIHCLKVLINTGIRTVYYEKEYKLHTVADLLGHARIKLVQIKAENPDGPR